MDTDYNLAIATLLIGGGIGWVIAGHFYKKAGAKSYAQFEAWARVAEEQRWAEFARDAEGKITTGRIIRLTISDSLNATDSITGAVVKSGPASVAGSGTVTNKGDSPEV